MTTTMAATVTNIRRMLGDWPARLTLGAAMNDTTTASLTASDASLVRAGAVFEVDDGGATGAEAMLVLTDQSTTPSVVRGYHGSTAATHSNGAGVWVNPRFEYNTVMQAVNMALDVDLWSNGIYDVTEHTVTSSATSHAYNAPSTSCETILDIYQRLTATDRPYRGLEWTQYRNADTTLWANGKYYEVYYIKGTLGTDSFYINCSHRLTITTINSQQERIVQMLAVAYLLEWEEIARSGGPTNQGDRTVNVGQKAGVATYYRNLAYRMIRDEQARLRDQTEFRREFKRR